MNEEMLQAMYDRLIYALKEVSKDGLSPQEKKTLSEEIKVLVNVFNSQDNLDLEREKFAYQKARDMFDDKDRQIGRYFNLSSDLLKLLGVIIGSGFSVAMLKAVLKYEIDGTVTTRIGQALFGRLINPKV